MTIKKLHGKIADYSAQIAVVGLGYVGLPVACLVAQKGYNVFGIDIDQTRVEKINQGINPIDGIEPGLSELVSEVIDLGNLEAFSDTSVLKSADIILVSVQTPIEEDTHKPRYAHMRTALKSIASVMKKEVLIIIESTLAPGTMHNVIIPALEEHSQQKAGDGFFIGHCPERVTPGKLLHNLHTMNRVVGGLTPEIAQLMQSFYAQYVQGDLDTTDILTAEIVKTAENAYRDVQIAFANELAVICETLGGDFWQAREFINKVPGRQVLHAGAGVGGHCIPKDPWLLIANSDYQTSLIPSARSVNRSMPQHIANLTEQALECVGKTMQSAIITVLGYAYMENSDDERDTPTAAYLELIKAEEVRIHDPFVPAYQGDFDEIVKGADAVVIMVKHDYYVQKDWDAVLSAMRTPVIIDARHILPDDFQSDDAIIRIIGKGR